MKKLFLLLVSSFLFIACSPFSANLEHISSMDFHLAVNQGTTEQQNESDLRLVPDYESRSLKVVYSKHFLNPSEDADFADLNSEGVLAGNFFDEFELALSDLVKNKELNAGMVDSGNFSISVSSVVEGEADREWMFNWNDEIESLDGLQEFFLNVVDKFDEDVY